MTTQSIQTEVQHSPAPWKVCGASEGKCSCGLIWSIPGDFVVATSPPCGDGFDDVAIPADEALANARLIAASPDMLAALENHAIPFLMSSVEAHDGDLSPDDEPQDDDPEDLIALRAVVQAIRKARGERESA